MGAYERDNFGDLLFLLVTERYLGGADVVAAAPFAADMRQLLGRRIPAFGPLLRDEAFDAVWTVGGQVGRVDLERAYKMSATPARVAALRAGLRGAPPRDPAPAHRRRDDRGSLHPLSRTTSRATRGR